MDQDFQDQDLDMSPTLDVEAVEEEELRLQYPLMNPYSMGGLDDEDGDNNGGKNSDRDNAEVKEAILTGDCSGLTELFAKSLNKKPNIYSTYPLPLNTPWTFWVDKTHRGVGVEEFEANLKRIFTFYTVHVFWSVYCNIPQPSALHNRSSLHLTRDERKPIWEEKYNCKGGTFRMRVNKKDTDKVWTELLMAAVGEQLNEYVSDKDEVCGVSVSVRDREDILLIWNTNAAEASKARIFECIKLLMPDTPFTSQFYKPHESHHAFEKPKIPRLSSPPRAESSESNPDSESEKQSETNGAFGGRRRTD